MQTFVCGVCRYFCISFPLYLSYLSSSWCLTLFSFQGTNLWIWDFHTLPNIFSGPPKSISFLGKRKHKEALLQIRVWRICFLADFVIPWWRWGESNSWPPACKAGALPAELHPHRLLICLVGLSGLEPPTSRLSGVRSNRLSYRPMQGIMGSLSSLRLTISRLFPHSHIRLSMFFLLNTGK